MPAPKILVIPGSLRTGSHNARLAALAAKELALAEAEVTRISLEDYPLPLFDADLAASSGMPQRRSRLKAHADGASGRVHHQPGILGLGDAAAEERHRLGVARARGRRSRPMPPSRTASLRSGRRRRAASGGVRSLMALRQILELGCGALVIPEQVSVPRADQAFDDMDNLKDETARRGDEGHGAAACRTWQALMRGRMRTMQLKPRDRLIVALDVSSVEAAASAGGAARRRGLVLQDRLSARLCRRACLMRTR